MAAISQSNAPAPNTAPRVARSRRSRLRIAFALGLIAVGTGIGIGAFLWWSDRELRAVEHHLDAEEFQPALTKADDYLDRHPRDTRAMILQARALAGLNRHKDADAAFTRAARLANGFPDDLPALRAWADGLLHLQEWSRAASLLESILDSRPDDHDALYKLTVARIRLRNYPDALKSAKRLSAVDAVADRADVVIGTIHHDMGNPRKALAVWEGVLARNPKAKDLNLPTYEFLAMVGEELLIVGNPKRAAAVLEQSLADRPTAGAYEFLGRAYAQLDRPKQAVDAWQKALKRNAGSRIAREELANAALTAGRPQEAIDWLTPLLRTNRVTSAAAYALQRSYTLLKQPAEAENWRKRAGELRRAERRESDLAQALRNNPAPFWSRYLQAYQEAADGRWSDAKIIVDQLLRQRPRESALRELAAAIEQKGSLPELKTLRFRKQ